MKLVRSKIAFGFVIFVIAVTARAQTPDDLALLKKVKDAEAAAPASRLTSTMTDRDSGAVAETAVVERVPPDEVHFITTRNGQPNSEMISDGKRSLRRSGPDAPWKPIPMNLSAMMNMAHSNLTDEHFREEHGHLKLIGDDKVDGVAAKIYELTEDSGTSKVWIAADTFRLLKVERDYDGNLSGPMKKDANGKVDLKSLSAQLKAATAQHHLHSVTTYHYDPSIKITMPSN